VFDVSRTEGKSPPEFDTEATGNAADLVDGRIQKLPTTCSH